METRSRLIGELVDLANRFCAATGQSRASLSKEIFGRGGHLDDLEQGRRDLATGTFERALDHFAARWPDSAQWPADVRRPEVQA